MIFPEWPAPQSVKAVITTRCGGVSEEPYDSLNLSLTVGDGEQSVIANRGVLQAGGVPETVQWLRQIHGTDVVYADQSASMQRADAVTTTTADLACAVLTADCLPVLFTDLAGTQVAAAHAGWRGLAAGILEHTVAAFTARPDQLIAYLGPAISQRYFEVGQDVRDAFLQNSYTHASQSRDVELAFTDSPQQANVYFADLYQLARIRLAKLGVTAIYGGDYCTYSQAELFYSFRRDGATGRMASLIYIESIS